MTITQKELALIATSLTEKHGLEAYGLASTLHMACGLFRHIQTNSGINLEHHVAILERACAVYGEVIGLESEALTNARLDIERSAKTVNIINSMED